MVDTKWLQLVFLFILFLCLTFLLHSIHLNFKKLQEINSAILQSNSYKIQRTIDIDKKVTKTNYRYHIIVSQAL